MPIANLAHLEKVYLQQVSIDEALINLVHTSEPNIGLIRLFSLIVNCVIDTVSTK